jgi:hypothetical protein
MMKSDTYHDTWTNYPWSKSLLRYKTKPMVMDAAIADRTNLNCETRDETCDETPFLGPCSGESCSRYSMSRTCGPRDMIS